jgi:hypothetical protein
MSPGPSDVASTTQEALGGISAVQAEVKLPARRVMSPTAFDAFIFLSLE